MLYLATSAAHGYAEIFRGFPNIQLREDHLFSSGFPLASVWVDLPSTRYEALPDLCVGAVLDRYGLRADTLTLPPHRRAETQAVSQTLWDDGQAGFRWWSAFHGGWHSTILFVEREPLSGLRFGPPTLARIDDPDVLAGARAAHMLIRP